MRAVIAGAGIAGLALAGTLNRAGWEVLVVEQSAGPRAAGYMMDFFGPGYDAAEAMGLLPDILEVGYRVREAAYVDRAGRRTAGLSYDGFARAAGGRMVSVLRPDLERVLREQVAGRVEIRYATPVRGATARGAGVRVALGNDTTESADLLVGADGVHSTVRGTAFGPEGQYVRHLGFATAAWTFFDAQVHAQVQDRFGLTDSIDRQVGLYGLRDGAVAVFAVHRSSGLGRPSDPRAAVRAAYAGLGWLVPAALAACPTGERLYYDDVAQVELPAWSRGRVVLLGDAAYAVSLLAGQGASLGIAGAYVLGTRLAAGGSVESGLRDYERTMRPVATDRQQAARSAARWFVPRSRRDLGLRRLVLRLSPLPGVKRLLARGLTGKTGIVRA